MCNKAEDDMIIITWPIFDFDVLERKRLTQRVQTERKRQPERERHLERET